MLPVYVGSVKDLIVGRQAAFSVAVLCIIIERLSLTLRGLTSNGKRQRRPLNRPFYSCVLSYLAMNASEAGGDLVLIQTSLLFSCKCQVVSIRTT